MGKLNINSCKYYIVHINIKYEFNYLEKWMNQQQQVKLFLITKTRFLWFKMNLKEKMNNS